MKRTLLCTLIAAAFLLTACTQKTPSAPEESQAGTELIIPMNERCESLNAAVAATIVMWQMKLDT